MNNNAGLIALDWGTSNLRAYLLSATGEILAERQDSRGILNIPDREFEAVLRDITANWCQADKNLPIIAAGMITSKQGWIETGYLPCPVDARQLAGGLVTHILSDGVQAHFVPGLSYDPNDSWPDVMRGEEVQILGASEAASDDLFILPGTHSKWAQLSSGVVESFRTFMTGEVFAVMKAHSILGRLITGEAFDPDGFDAGVKCVQSGGGAGILSCLFSGRSLALFDRLPGEQIESYLSGLLIAAEISEGRDIFDLDQGDVIIVGSDKLVDLYRDALALFEIETRQLEGPASVRGLHRIAVAAGMVAND
jgi:2-dehydro-3-deoxygalactonokinase